MLASLLLDLGVLGGGLALGVEKVLHEVATKLVIAALALSIRHCIRDRRALRPTLQILLWRDEGNRAVRAEAPQIISNAALGPWECTRRSIVEPTSVEASLRVAGHRVLLGHLRRLHLRRHGKERVAWGTLVERELLIEEHA